MSKKKGNAMRNPGESYSLIVLHGHKGVSDSLQI